MNSHQIILLVFIGYIVFAIDKKKEAFPVPVVLLLLGISFSFIPYFSDIQITKEIIFDWFLPALLFVSAYQFPILDFKKYFKVITILGTFGLIGMFLLLGISLYAISGFFTQLSFLESLLLAIILMPTDPVSVVPILKKSSKSSKVADVVEGESMFNDGTGLVLFTIVLGMLVNGESFSFMNFVSEFFLVSLGGIGIGVIFGWFVLKGLHLTSHSQYKVMVSITLAYGSFYIAEHFHFSGVLASVASGIIFSWKLGQSEEETELRRSLDGFWEVIEPTILSILFIVIGIQATQHLSLAYWEFILLIFVLTLLVRFVVLTVVFKPISYFTLNEISLITCSGLKGTMSIVFILSLKANSVGINDLLISLSFGIVVLSLIIQSVFIYPLSKKLKS
ncbi:CPA1 family monovalent cation:H+ antiporter [Metabacillus crassostreae]|uniref:cation:proton antiporter n=1 Tax=Metabacillus crassostreae TaxID=929098 RepID=UPI00195D6ECC|nr:cation:proton antiporter [Metabacillus crassostreae]MBM7604843.1 CPA1 family monovalent cation:H+ antiporter [Metabacillus crassostreae]